MSLDHSNLIRADSIASSGALEDQPSRLACRAPSLLHTRFLPHEWVFSCFLFVTWARLCFRAQGGSLEALAFLGLLLASFGIIYWASRKPTPSRWRVRLLWYPAMMGISFAILHSVVALLKIPSADAFLARLDSQLLGTNVLDLFEQWNHPLLTEAMMGAYLFFFYYLIAGPAYYCLRNLSQFRECFAGLFTLYGLSFTAYTCLPALGPLHYLSPGAPLEGGWLTTCALPLINSGSNGVDVFPSIHFAASFYLLVFDWWYYRKRFWWLLSPCLLMWISTLYLRYHYLVDLIGGAAIAIIGLAVARMYAHHVAQKLSKAASSLLAAPQPAPWSVVAHPNQSSPITGNFSEKSLR
jgi:membrane-associated phospholipid phosphatase